MYTKKRYCYRRKYKNIESYNAVDDESWTTNRRVINNSTRGGERIEIDPSSPFSFPFRISIQRRAVFPFERERVDRTERDARFSIRFSTYKEK